MVPRSRLPFLHKAGIQCHRHECLPIGILFRQLTLRPPVQAAPLKRPLSPGPDESSDNTKRSRVELSKRRISSPSGGKRTPIPSTRPSPTPYRPQPASRSPEMRDHFPTSPLPLQVVLPLILSQWGLATHRTLHQAVLEVLKEVAVAAVVRRPILRSHPSQHCLLLRVQLLRQIIVRGRIKCMWMPDPCRLRQRGWSKMLDGVRGGSSSRSPSTKQSQSPPVEKETSS
jgi:hypothetical protein